jgi:colanic acid/amylovoran biosynthesis protein
MTRRWMRWIFNISEGNWARESISNQFLLSHGAPSTRTHVVADAAFGFSSDINAHAVDLNSLGIGQDRYVAFSVRQLDPTGHAPENEQRYFDSVISSIEWLTAHTDLVAAIVSHTQGPVIDEDDRIASRRVYASLSENARTRTKIIDEDLSPTELISVYGRAELVVATRFHAVVLAMCGGSPVIAIPYFGTKTQGAFRDLGLTDLLLEVRDMSPESLREKMKYCLDSRVELRQRIRQIARNQYGYAMQTGAETKQIARRNERVSQGQGAPQRQYEPSGGL